MYSLQTRLGTGLFISLTLAILAMWLVLGTTIRYLAEDYMTTRLEHDSETILGTLVINQQGSMELDTGRLDVIYRKPFSGHYFKVVTEQQTIRSRSLWDQDMSVQTLAPGTQSTLHLTGPEQQPLLILVTGYRKHNQFVTIAVAEDLSHIESALTDFQWKFSLAAIVFLILLILMQVYIVRHGMRPLNRVREELRALERGELQSLDTPVPSEVSPLIKEINRLVNVTNQRLQRSRNALGDLAHTLKKPLTVLNQLSRDPVIEKHETIKQTLNEQTSAMRQSMDRVLKQARLAGEGPAGSQFSAHKEVSSLIRVLNAMYSTRNLEFETRIPQTLVMAYDREDMHELFGNIMDNACKWANKKIRVTVAEQDGINISIEDDGPGADENRLAMLTDRGTRLDEAVEGHGIGLAIVKDIVEQYHGELVFSRSELLGGFCVKISLPEHYSPD